MKKTRLISGALVVSLGAAASAQESQFIVPDGENVGWVRGETPGSLFAFWDNFSSVAGPNSPDAFGSIPFIFSAGDFDSFDANSADSGTFICCGGNIYSFSGINTPLTIVPGFGFGYGNQTTILYQVRTLGRRPDNDTFLANGYYEPAELVVLSDAMNAGPFGGANVETLVRFEIPRSDDVNDVFFSAVDTSLSFDVAVIDAFTREMDCPVDVDLNGSADFFDAITFLRDVDRNDGDWNGDTATDDQDVADYITGLAAGCSGG